MKRIDQLLFTGYPEIAPETPIRRAAALLVEAHAAAAPVVDADGMIVGIVTQKDCFRSALSASYYQEWKGTVADHMTTEVRSLPPDTDLATAANAFLDHPHRAFPVIEEGHVLGLLRREDVLAALLELG